MNGIFRFGSRSHDFVYESLANKMRSLDDNVFH